MPYLTVMAKVILLVSGMQVSGVAVGTGAYYHEVSLREVCERRMEQNWVPLGIQLDCSNPCLAAAISTKPSELGGYWLADLPGGSLHV